MKIEAGSISSVIRKFCKFVPSSVDWITPAPDSMDMNKLCIQGTSQQHGSGHCQQLGYQVGSACFPTVAPLVRNAALHKSSDSPDFLRHTVNCIKTMRDREVAVQSTRSWIAASPYEYIISATNSCKYNQGF